jgi:hypothetical protein
MKLNKINNSLWEIETDQTDQLRRVGAELCEAAHTDAIGVIDDKTPAERTMEQIYFIVRFNGLLVEFLHKRELWMFGLALQVAAEAIPIQLIGMVPVKANN